MILNNDTYLTVAVEMLRRWRDTMPNTAVAHVDWRVLNHLLNELDVRSNLGPRPYTPKTFFVRAEFLESLEEKLGADGLMAMVARDILEDLKNAEAALGINNDDT